MSSCGVADRSPPARWEPLRPCDLVALGRIAGIVHPAYPERDEVPAERLALFGPGCFAAWAGPAMVGYAISHPARRGDPPALDTLLGTLPTAPDCLYLHDVALLPAARGAGLGAALIARLVPLARARGLPALALVAVGGSCRYWAARGFRRPPEPSAGLAAKLASYGDSAAYMERPL